MQRRFNADSEIATEPVLAQNFRRLRLLVATAPSFFDFLQVGKQFVGKDVGPPLTAEPCLETRLARPLRKAIFCNRLPRLSLIVSDAIPVRIRIINREKFRTR